MTIESDEQLRVTAMQAGELLQDIQTYLGREIKDGSRVSFPRGLLRTAEEHRQECPGYLSHVQKSSCAYGFMYLDVLWWLYNRTDIAGIAKEMVFKSAIITLGTITEAILHIPNQGIFDSNAGVELRLDRACALGWISEADRDKLKGLWQNRNNVHLRLLDSTEFNKYNVKHVTEPREALDRLMTSLRQWHTAR